MENPYAPPRNDDRDSPDGANIFGRRPGPPTSITVFGILNCVFGGLGLLGVPIGFVFLYWGAEMAQVGPPNPAIEAMKNPAYRAFSIVSILLGGIASIVEIIGGVGLLRTRMWGRTLSLAYAIYGIAMTLISFGFQYAFVFSPLMLQGRKANDPQAVGAAVGGIFGGACGILIAAIYPILLLIFLNRSNVIQALKRNADVEVL